MGALRPVFVWALALIALPMLLLFGVGFVQTSKDRGGSRWRLRTPWGRSWLQQSSHGEQDAKVCLEPKQLPLRSE
jgi:hypothetical protein